MATSERSMTGLDADASIKAFLAKIPQPAQPRASSAQQQIEKVARKVSEADVLKDTPTDTEAHSKVPSAIPSTASSNVASPNSKASDSLPVEKVSQWVYENAPPDHFKSKNPLIEHVQAHDTPYGSPQATGVLAPPPTPETVSSLAIGQMISDELDNIPEERFMSLGDSKYAPKNPSRLSTTARPGFYSPVPQTTRPRDDPDFTRMSFKAADTPTIPAFINPMPIDMPAAEKSFLDKTRRASSELRENANGNRSKDAWSQTSAAIGFNLFKSDTSTTPPAPPHLRPVDLDHATTFYTKLKPADFDKVNVPRVFTPDTSGNNLEDQVQEQGENGSTSSPSEKLYSNSNPFAETNVPRLFKGDTPQASDKPRDNAVKGAWMKREEEAESVHIESETGLQERTTEERHQRKKQANEEKSTVVLKPTIGIKTKDLAAQDTTVGETSSGALTPSSMTFTSISPSKVRAAGITTAIAQPAKIVGENLEGALYFKAWPKADERGPRSAAKHRKLHLTGLPRDSTPTFVLSLVYGGPLESISVGSSTTASVTFLRTEDAMKYYDATANGLLFKTKDGVEHVIMTQLGKDVDPVSGVLREWTEKEFTRCVRAVGVDEDWTMEALYETARKKGRKVEKIVDGTNVNKMRSVTFRFCDIADAVKFKQTLNRAEEWEECNVHYAPDPCADATGFHFE